MKNLKTSAILCFCGLFLRSGFAGAQSARPRSFSATERLIGAYKSSGQFDRAADLERQQSAFFRAKGLADAAIIHANRAAALTSQLQIFADVATTARGAGKLYSGAPLEPVLGCYLGAFIDRDDSLGGAFWGDGGQTHRSPAQFARAAGRNPGSLFMYLRYGAPFPATWVANLKAEGTIPHLAWEPRDLGAVRDDAYLRSFARAARAADWPVFVRFASEMNGAWTPYHGNPALYKSKFRLVNRVLHQEAPRAATIWCVNNPPLGNALDYYPGDDGCDWVGVNFYAVPFHENKRSRPAFEESPLALLDPIYARFAARKPIAICEFAAAHQSAGNAGDYSNFAREKLQLLYGALPLLYPRVKMVNWFDMNTIARPTPGKARNNYLLTAPGVLPAWQSAVATPHFLSSYQSLGDVLPPVARPLQGLKLRNRARIRVWAASFGGAPEVRIALDGKPFYRARKFGAHAFDLNLSALAPGNHVLSAQLFDFKGRFQRGTRAVFAVWR